MVEALDTIMLTLQAALAEQDEYDLMLLSKMTGDRSSVMQSIRELYLSDEEAKLGPEEKLRLLNLTNLCERLLWLLGAFTKGLESSRPNESPKR